MNDQDRITAWLEDSQALMRGKINTVGIEDAAKWVADELAGPFNTSEHARIRGVILAAFEAGMSHQIARTR